MGVTITNMTPGFFYVFVEDVDYVTPVDGELGTINTTAGPLTNGIHRVTVKDRAFNTILDQDVTVDCTVTPPTEAPPPAVAAATASESRFTG